MDTSAAPTLAITPYLCVDDGNSAIASTKPPSAPR